MFAVVPPHPHALQLLTELNLTHLEQYLHEQDVCKRCLTSLSHSSYDIIYMMFANAKSS